MPPDLRIGATVAGTAGHKRLSGGLPTQLLTMPTERRLQAHAGMAAFLLASIIVAGCFEGETDSGESNPEMDEVAKDWGLHTEDKAFRFMTRVNGSFRIPFFIDEGSVIQGLSRVQGNMSDGFSVFYRHNASQTLIIVDDFWETHEFSKQKIEDASTSQFQEICWSNRTRTAIEDPACQLRSRPRGDLDERGLGEGVEIPAGNGTFLVVVETTDYIELEFGFNTSSYVVGNVTPMPHMLRRFATETFRATHQDIERCIIVAWCGMIQDGNLSIEPVGDGLARFRFLAVTSATAVMTVCKEESATGLECLTPIPRPSGGVAFLIDEWLDPADGPVEIRINATSALDESTGRKPWFYITGILITTPFPDGA